ncbi:regulatory protein RecX [Desulfurobacterium thermolithotrophum]|uniref:regulatory protein RecX n=1 Tax=Desulfurobacterium thermolithotrophum TaxID=64160 RepID=UPI0013D2F938|nr:regulatory protein RecX [Desulfurobacterium thermolithotrophum]
MDLTFKKIYTYTIFLLSKKDYSPQSLRKKILEKFPEAENQIINNVVDTLKKEKFLNEFRTAHNYFTSKMEKGWGKRKIRYSLRQKGFSEEVIKELETSIEFDYSFIKREIEKKFGQVKDKKLREKAKRFLLQRGFSYCEIENIL